MFNCAPLQQLFHIETMENRYLQSIFILVAIFFFLSLFSKRLPSASAHASSRACHWLMDGVNDALSNAQQAMAQNIAVTSDDVSSTRKIIIKLKVNPLIKHRSKFLG